jgi:hypothetical protein
MKPEQQDTFGTTKTRSPYRPPVGYFPEENSATMLGKMMIGIIALILLGAIIGLCTGCSVRQYTYEKVSPDGTMAKVGVMVQGTDAQVGVIDAGSESPDGARTWIHVENLTQTDRAMSALEKAIDKLPTVPLPIP